VHPGDLAGEFSDLEMTWFSLLDILFTVLAPPLCNGPCYSHA